MKISKHQHQLSLVPGATGTIALRFPTRCGKTELPVKLVSSDARSKVVRLELPSCGCYEYFVPSRTSPADRLWPQGQVLTLSLNADGEETLAATSESAHVHSWVLSAEIGLGETKLRIEEQGLG